MLLIEPISAITSWEDYEYQGHLALYIALKRIFDLLHKYSCVHMMKNSITQKRFD